MQEEMQVHTHKTPSFLDEPENNPGTDTTTNLELEPKLEEVQEDPLPKEEVEEEIQEDSPPKEEIKEISFGTPPPEVLQEKKNTQEPIDPKPPSPIKETRERSRSPKPRSPSPIKETRETRERSRSPKPRSPSPIKETRERSLSPKSKSSLRERSVSPEPESEEEIEEPTVYRCGDINPKYMEFKKPVKRTGSYFIEIGYKGENMYIQTNKLRVVSSKSKFGKFELDEELYNLITRTDTRIQNVCAERSKEFFKGKEISIEQIEYGYKTPVQILNGYRSKLCSSIFVLSGSENVQIYNNKLENITLDKVKEDDYAKILLKLSGVNITPREIQPVWEIVQMKTYTKMNISKPFFVQEETYPEADMISRM